MLDKLRALSAKFQAPLVPCLQGLRAPVTDVMSLQRVFLFAPAVTGVGTAPLLGRAVPYLQGQISTAPANRSRAPPWACPRPIRPCAGQRQMSMAGTGFSVWPAAFTTLS